MLINFAKLNLAADLKALCEVALTLAKHEKVFREGRITKECAIKMVLAFGDKKLSEVLKIVFIL